MAKSRYWSCMIYPDSQPKNWKEIITDWMLPVCVSPLHDRDVNKDGTIKKPHRHVLICFNGPTTYNNALEYAKQLNAQIVKTVGSVKGSYEYWYHKNNPEKAQYEEQDIICLGGFNIKDIPKTENEIEEIKRQIINIINDQNITEYKACYDYFNERDMIECCQIISTKTIFFNAYIKSKKFMIDEELKKC